MFNEGKGGEKDEESKKIYAAIIGNLGLRLFGIENELVTYDPNLHQDTVGGILPGDSVRMLSPGCMFEDQVVMRAKIGKG